MPSLAWGVGVEGEGRNRCGQHLDHGVGMSWSLLPALLRLPALHWLPPQAAATRSGLY